MKINISLTSMTNTKTLNKVALVLIFLAAVPIVLSNIISIPAEVSITLRWILVAWLGYMAFVKKNLTFWIITAMVAGVAFGYDAPSMAVEMDIFSKIFLKLIKCIVAPLIFATLVVGIAGHSNMKQVGRMGWKSLIYFEVVTTFALFVGLAAINISQAGVNAAKVADTATNVLPTIAKQNFKDIILHSFPENIAKSIAEGQVLQVVVFSIIFAMGIGMLSPDKKRPMMAFAESLSETMFKFTNIIMFLAPIGVFGSIAATVGHQGLDILISLFKLLATLYVALAVFIGIVLLPIALFLRINIKKFAQAIAEPVSIAFATATSEAALPKAMEALEKFGVPRKVVSFVMPTGYTFNLDGTTLYLSLASVFVAQAAGVDMSFSQQVIMVFTLMLTSKGVAGVPRASLVILLGTAATFGLPEWPIGIILGIDALMDMGRTAVNVTGNCLATVAIAKWEKEM